MKILFTVFLLIGVLYDGDAQEKPNVILIYTDDLGYGDLSCYGAKQIQTPNIDRLAKEGRLFRNAYATSATCTPSRFSMLTGVYAWRRKDTGIAPGNAQLLIDPNKITLPAIFKKAGYKTSVVGKWHLGLGDKQGPQWNEAIKPGPLELGFDESFIIPATVDRVPCVFVEGHHVVNFDPSDPIEVSYKNKIGNQPTGIENPELLKMKPSHGHDQTIVNGISRIGFMKGGKKALWRDEDIADIITKRALSFIQRNAGESFFLYFSTHDIHVPRVPHERFAGKNSMGPRGDVILQLDWSVGEILKQLDAYKISDKTIIIFTSDNGPVVDDGYNDQAVDRLGSHKPAGHLRGGKYSAFEGGTRVPLIIRWPWKIKPGISENTISQIDFMASFSNLIGLPLAQDEATDSFDASDALFGDSKKGRDFIVQHAINGTLSLVKDGWKYIEPSNGNPINTAVNIELGYDPNGLLFNLMKDEKENNNLSHLEGKQMQELKDFLENVKGSRIIRH